MLCTVNSYSCVKRHASATVYRNACGVLCAVVSVLRLCCVYILHRYSVVAIVAVHKTIQCTIIDHDLPYCCFFFYIAKRVVTNQLYAQYYVLLFINRRSKKGWF